MYFFFTAGNPAVYPFSLKLEVLQQAVLHRWIKSKFTSRGGGGLGKLYPGKLNTPFCTKNRNISTNFIILIENRTKNAITIVISCEILFKIFKKLKFMRNILSRLKKALWKKINPICIIFTCAVLFLQNFFKKNLAGL